MRKLAPAIVSITYTVVLIYITPLTAAHLIMCMALGAVVAITGSVLGRWFR